MKSFLVTLLIIGAAFLGYDYFLTPPQRRIVFERPPVATPTEPVVTESSGKKKVPVAPAPDHTPDPTPAPVAEAPRPVTAPPVETKPVFTEPKFVTIESLTKGWSQIPKSAFPRPVKLLKDATFTLGVGSSLARAGTEVVALSMENAQMVVAPSAASQAHAAVALDDTDLKSRLVSNYEEWKVDRIAEARKQFDELQRQPKAAPIEANTMVDAAGKPVMAVNGTYPLLVERLKTGNPSEITPYNIIRWREPEAATINGAPGWTVEVKYKTKTLFGEMEVESLAQVLKGKVVNWVYKGSGELVP